MNRDYHSDLICHFEVWHGLENRIKYEDKFDTKKAWDLRTKYIKDALIYAGKRDFNKPVLYYIIQHDEDLDVISKISYFKDTEVSYDKIDELILKMPCAEFGILYPNSAGKLSKRIVEEEKSKHIAPITLKEANIFVKAHHRHHDSVTGCKFAIGLYKTIKGQDTLIGTAICGRPVSRLLDDGYTLEINRLCVTEDGNCCSMLYGACSRIAKEMGYRKIITYILESEPGTTLKASNFTLEDDCCGGKNWTGSRKRNRNTAPEEMKQRWGRVLIT